MPWSTWFAWRLGPPVSSLLGLCVVSFLCFFLSVYSHAIDKNHNNVSFDNSNRVDNGNASIGSHAHRSLQALSVLTYSVLSIYVGLWCEVNAAAVECVDTQNTIALASDIELQEMVTVGTGLY